MTPRSLGPSQRTAGPIARWTLGLLTLALLWSPARTAVGLSLVIETDQAAYAVGETATITATLDTSASGPGSSVRNLGFNNLFLSLGWDSDVARVLGSDPASGDFGGYSQLIVSGANAGGDNLVSLGGSVPWLTPAPLCPRAGSGAGSACSILDQLLLVVGGPALAPDPSILVGTLQLEVFANGPLDLRIDNFLNNLGELDPQLVLTPLALTLGPNASIVIPEPGTGMLVGLGLLGISGRVRIRR